MTEKDRTGYADGGDGLVFDWKTRRTPGLRMCGVLVVAMAIFVVPLMLVRIHVGAPLVEDSQSASMMVISHENDPMQWFGAARELGPFPSRYDPVEWRSSRAVVDDVLARARARSMPEHAPRYQGFPDDPPPPAVPLVTKGSRHLPPVAAPKFEPMEAIEVRLRPVLYPLSVDAVELPDASPVFDVDVTSEMASQPWRFLLQVEADGAVQHALALIGHNTPGRAELTDWLQAHRFPVQDDVGGRWVAVAVTFQNLRSDGADDS